MSRIDMMTYLTIEEPSIASQRAENRPEEDRSSDRLRLENELRALTEVAKTLTAPLELPELLEAALCCMAQVLEPAEAGVIMLWDPSAGLFRAAASIGFDRDALARIGLRSGESITGKVYDSSQAWLLESPETVAQAMGNLRTANLSYLQQAGGWIACWQVVAVALLVQACAGSTEEEIGSWLDTSIGLG